MQLAALLLNNICSASQKGSWNSKHDSNCVELFACAHHQGQVRTLRECLVLSPGPQMSGVVVWRIAEYRFVFQAFLQSSSEC